MTIAAAFLLASVIAGAPSGWVRATTDTVVLSKGQRVIMRPGVGMIVWPGGEEDASLPGVVASLFARDSLGMPWPRWIEQALPADCEPYHAASYEPVEDVFWVYQCRWTSDGVVREAECFLLGQDSMPTLERTRWSAGPASGLRGWQTGAFADSLVRRLAGLTGATPRLGAREIHGGRYGRWLQIAEFAASGGTLRLMRGDDGDSRDSLVLEQTSRRLDDALASAFEHGSPYREEDEEEAARAGRVTAARAEVARALQPVAPRLAQALGSSPSRANDARAVAAELMQAGHGHDPATADLIQWGTHLWGRGLGIGDSAAAGEVNRAFGGRDGRWLEVRDGWCWEDSLFEALAKRAGEDRWTDAAFLALLDLGWQASCELCGYDSAIGTDLFRPVITHGKEFLLRHPDSPIAREVLWRVAEAHETAWSLSKVLPGDDYIDPAQYLLDAPVHRSRAIELYEKLLPGEPDGPRRRAAFERLRRIKLDVDTGFHDYWCEWD